MIAPVDTKKVKVLNLQLNDTPDNRELVKRLNIAAIKKDMPRKALLEEILKGCFTRKRENGNGEGS